MHNLKNNLDKCTGCHACEQSCPTGAITFGRDEYGFIFPEFNEEKCINCGLCEKRCHMLLEDKNQLLYSEKQRTACYGWHKNPEIRAASSSGGAFTAILDIFLPDDGVVFGATYNEDFTYVYHEKATKAEFKKFRKSKYVFCDPMQTFSEALAELEKGKKVLFTGTPCQIAGLKRYLSKDYDNLLTMDFICHGTPSIDFYNDHIASISRSEEVKNVDFRSKALGWVLHCLKVDYGSKTYVRSMWKDFYFHNFLQSKVLRECCYGCQYSNGNHVSDITVADFWGITKYKPEMNDEKGISLIVFNNEKTKDVFYPEMKESMELYDLDFEHYKYVYKSHSIYPLEERNQILKDYREKGYKTIQTKWQKTVWIQLLKRRIGKMLGH